MTESNKSVGRKLEDVHSVQSDKSGVAGFFETLLRRFRLVSFLFSLMLLYVLAVLAMGVSATPGVWLVFTVLDLTAGWFSLLKYLLIALSVVSAFFCYGFVLIFVVPLFNRLMPFRIKPFRGSYYSIESVPWYFHNAFTYIVRYTFLEFITPTPLNILFFKMMGMKIGKGVNINTTNISDPGLIELGDHVTLGGSVHLMAHYGQKGYLILEKVKIGAGTTIGLKATIMGNVEIGEHAVIAPHEVIYPKSRIPANRRPEISQAEGYES